MHGFRGGKFLVDANRTKRDILVLLEDNDLKYNIVVLLVACLASSCSPVPEPVTYGHTIQAKVQSAYHWEVMADDVAKQIRARLDKPYGTGKDAGTFYVSKSAVSTPFSEGFHDLLISSISREGMPVVSQKMDGVRVVDYEVKVVHHKTDRGAYRPESLAGKVLRRGITVVRDVLTLGAIPAENVPHSEVMVTVSIVENNEYILHKTDIYYINDPDFWHYGSSGPTPKTMAVVGEK